MWYMPSYNRPQSCKDALDSFVRCGMLDMGLVIVNEDDPQIDAYMGLELPFGWRVVTIKEGSRSADAHRAAFSLYPNEKWYGVLADDLRCETPGFEKVLVEAAGTANIASANDGWKAPRRMHGAAVFGGDLVRHVGWLAPPGFTHCYVDDVWETIGRDLGIWKVLMNVHTPHLHPARQKGWDEGKDADLTYTRANADIDEMRKRFERWIREERDPLYERLAEAGYNTEGPLLTIATPVKESYAPDFLAAYDRTARALASAGVRWTHEQLIGMTFLDQARNILAARFLASRAKYLLFVDADMAWDPNAVLRLISMDVPLVAVAGRRKLTETKYCIRMPQDENGDWLFKYSEDMRVLQVDGVGTGFMLIRRDVFLELMKTKAKLCKVQHTNATANAFYYDFFQIRREPRGDGEVGIQGEDYSFCQDVQAMGVPVLVKADEWLVHVGDHRYFGILREYMLEHFAGETNVEPPANPSAAVY